MITKENMSFVFTDSPVKIILVDREFKPLDSESKVFCSIFKSVYKECKNLFTLGTNEEMVWYDLGKGNHVVFIIYPIVDYKKINEMCSMISRVCAKDGSIALLNAMKDFRIERYLSTVLDLDLRSYEKALI